MGADDDRPKVEVEADPEGRTTVRVDQPARDRLTTVETDIKWLKWVSTGTFVAVLGQYVGINGAVAEAAARFIP